MSSPGRPMRVPAFPPTSAAPEPHLRPVGVLLLEGSSIVAFHAYAGHFRFAKRAAVFGAQFTLVRAPLRARARGRKHPTLHVSVKPVAEGAQSFPLHRWWWWGARVARRAQRGPLLWRPRGLRRCPTLPRGEIRCFVALRKRLPVRIWSRNASLDQHVLHRRVQESLSLSLSLSFAPLAARRCPP